MKLFILLLVLCLTISCQVNKCAPDIWLEERSNLNESKHLLEVFNDTLELWKQEKRKELKVPCDTCQNFISHYVVLNRSCDKAILFWPHFTLARGALKTYYSIKVITAEKVKGDWNFYYFGNLTYIERSNYLASTDKVDSLYVRKLAVDILNDGVLNKRRCKVNQRFIKKYWFQDWKREKHFREFW